MQTWNFAAGILTLVSPPQLNLCPKFETRWLPNPGIIPGSAIKLCEGLMMNSCVFIPQDLVVKSSERIAEGWCGGTKPFSSVSNKGKLISGITLKAIEQKKKVPSESALNINDIDDNIPWLLNKYEDERQSREEPDFQINLITLRSVRL
ncbi:hypothetical protein CEXT_255021 [Caerostris extrusa]|uniref:Uncharacterized protein n=1 Tax=Caerostris extrusa TaxID=172846 RepID=A0AAV4RZ56_CAEEX|nr:hypothetical protein CEXT_255021 [Caerostris extrusa]